MVNNWMLIRIWNEMQTYKTMDKKLLMLPIHL